MSRDIRADEAQWAGRARGTAPEVILSLILLFNLALTQPLLELLGQYVELFLARGSGSTQIIVQAAALAIGAPLALALFCLLFRAVHHQAGRVLHGLFFFLAGLVALQALKRLLPSAPVALQLGLAAALGALLYLAWYRSSNLRALMYGGLVLPFLLGWLFLYNSPVEKLMGAASVEVADVTIGKPAPVVLVVFDELPLASIMDREGDLDTELFPNFARLGRTRPGTGGHDGKWEHPESSAGDPRWPVSVRGA